MKIIQGIEQNTDEWRLWRNNHIGASDASIILGLNPWRTPLQLWEEKVLGWEVKSNANMKRGQEMENDARFSYESLKGNLFPAMVAECSLFPYISASFDGYNLELKKGLEIKCGYHSHKLAQINEIPEYYIAQLQHQMWVGELQEMDYYSFNGKEGILITIERDEDFIENMINKEIEFYECIKNKTPPEILNECLPF